MGGHHKKNLRAEKAKVKLKGAKLPKGLNVTKTEFKVRKITIKDQLRDVKIVEGQRQLSLKEALSRMKHHSPSLRSEGLRNLKEIIASGQNDIEGQLGTIFQSVAAISLDCEKDARRESYKTLSTLLQTLNEERVTPFFHILSSYLRCGMTHIQPAIQEDALTMLDVLLEYVPGLVALHSEKIFQNFLEMISRVRADGNRADRTLTVHMGQDQTTVKWRSKILLRLREMLKTLVHFKKELSVSKGFNRNQCKLITYKANEPQHFNLLRSCKSNIPDLDEIFNRTVGTNILNTGSDECKKLRKRIEMLMPLLMESWLEVSPLRGSSNTQILLSGEAALTMQIVLEIMKNLWELVDIYEADYENDDVSKWFRSEFGEKYFDYFLTSFPYQKSQSRDDSGVSKNKKMKLSAESNNCDKQNIIVTYLACRFLSNNVTSYDSKIPTLIDYLMKCLKNLRTLSIEDQQLLATSLHYYLLENAKTFVQKYFEHCQNLLKTTIEAFLNNNFNYREGVSAIILVLLCEIIQKHDLFVHYGKNEFKSFLEYLPQLLLKQTITINSLLAMSNLGKQKNEVFLKALEPTIKQVIENISKIQVTGAANAFEGKKLIMNLFYWTDHQWNVATLEQHVQDHINDKRMVSYFKYIINNK